MPHFKVDDMMHSHPKARRAGLAALGLWTVAGSYCMAYKSDGFVPAWFVGGWPQGPKLAALLVKAQLWAPTARGDELGWQFHDWEDVNLSAVEIEQQREFSRERQRRYRANASAARNGHKT